MPKPLTMQITINCGKFFKRWEPDHLTCLLRHLYAGQEATVRTGHGTTDCSKLGVQGKRNPSKTVGVARGHQRADTLKPHSPKTSQSNHTRTTALSNSTKLSHALWGQPRRAGHGGQVWQNVVHWRREWQTTSVFLPWEPHEQYEKRPWV